jgi:hypothetical protein
MRTVLQIVRVHIVVAFLVGLIVGTLIGLGEGVNALLSQGVLGRYDELVAWAIAVDASALIAVEFGLAVISGVIFLVRRREPVPRWLVALQLGETVFILTFALILWSQGTVDPYSISDNPLGVLLPAALAGLGLGELTLIGSMWLMVHAPFLARLRARYWLLAETAVVLLAVVFAIRR